MNSKKTAENFNAALQQLKESYTARLPEDFAKIKHTLNELDNQSCHQSQLENLRQLFHKMAGTSGTFGLSELGLKARAIERKINQKIKSGRYELSADEISELKTDLDEIVSVSTVMDASASFEANEKMMPAVEQLGNRLWLIEDDQLLANELKRQFETFGYSTEVFHSLNDADIAAQKQEPDAIVIDVMFEEAKLNATEKFGQSSNLQQLKCPIIFMSAYDDFDSRIRAVQLKAKGYFLKPVSVPAIVNHLRRVFEAQNLPGSSILIVEDDEDLAQHFKLVLESAGFEAKYLLEPERIIELLNEFNPEVVLMDLHMPGYSGIELAGVIRQHEKWMSLPILYLSAETDIEIQANALEQGAEDFLTKPINDVQLISTVRARVIRTRQLDEKISRDGLTGLLKHAVIKEAVNHEVTRSHRNSKPCTVVMLDIDHFKAVNDNYGHAIGDVVISAISIVLQQRLRNTDIIGRYGGEEFVAVLPECSAQQAYNIFDNIRQSFNQVEFTSDNKKFTCSFSAGLICTEDFPGLNGEEMLVSADTSLYHSKKNGRNQITSASDILTPMDRSL